MLELFFQLMNLPSDKWIFSCIQTKMYIMSTLRIVPIKTYVQTVIDKTNFRILCSKSFLIWNNVFFYYYYNPVIPTLISHPYQLDEYILNVRWFGSKFRFHSNFISTV